MSKRQMRNCYGEFGGCSGRTQAFATDRMFNYLPAGVQVHINR